MGEPSVFGNLYGEDELYSIPSRTMILLDREWTAYAEEEKNLLLKILASVKLSFASVQILHINGLSVNDLLPFNPSKVISFGVPVSPVQKMYEYIPVDEVHIIVADSLGLLDESRKKNLWLALRQMFGV
jgi:hypothetical protein